MARGGRKNLDDLFDSIKESGWALVGLIFVLGIGVWAVSWLRSRFADDADSATESHRLLTQIGDLKEQGDLTEEEYRSIKGRLVERIDDTHSTTGEKAPSQQASQFETAEDLDVSEPNEGNSQQRNPSDN